MLAVQKTKLEQLSRIQGPRIILIGGSGLGMGMLTSELAKELNHPVYNMGLHAGLGLIYQMCLPPSYQLKNGDLIVIVPEYANFNGESCFGDQELVAMVSDILPEHRKYLSLSHWFRLWQHVARHGAGKIRKCFLPERPSNPSDSYDSFGDCKWGNKPPDAQLVFPVAKRLSASNFSPTILQYIRSYIDTCKEKGVRVVLLPPAYQAQSYDNQSEYIRKIEQELERGGMPFLVPTKRYRLDRQYFYDTPYHLNLIGRRLRTHMMIADLKGYLQNGHDTGIR